MKKYNKSRLKENYEKWYLHQYCLSKNIPLSNIKRSEKLILDKSLTDELNYLKNLVRPDKIHKQRIAELEGIIEKHRTNIKETAPQYNWEDYNWDSHHVYESHKNSKEVNRVYTLGDQSMRLTFNKHDLERAEIYKIEEHTIYTYEVEKFRNDMDFCAISLGLMHGLNNNMPDTDGRVAKLLRTICYGYSSCSDIIIYFEEKLHKKVSRDRISYCSEQWMQYCRSLDRGVDKYTNNSQWQKKKESFLERAKEDAVKGCKDAENFVVFYTGYETLSKASEAKANKLLELKLPNINDINIALDVTKYSTFSKLK